MLHPVPGHLVAEGRRERWITRSTIVVSLATMVTYLGWRVTSTIEGASLPLALALLGVEIWFSVRHVITVLPPLVLPMGGESDRSEDVPYVDIVVVVRDEPLHVLEVSLKSCLEVRGRQGVAVVNRDQRPEVADLCARMNLAVIDPAAAPDLGTEVGRPAPVLILVPGSSWVSADLAVMAAGALAEPDVGAVTLSNTTHGLVWLVGTRGYLPPAFGDDRLAMRFDSAGIGGLPNGPLLVRKDAVRAVGGVCWAARDPILTTGRMLTTAGWRARSLTAPGSYRMAPANESLVLEERAIRSADWVDAHRRTATLETPSRPLSRGHRFWQRFVVVSAAVERLSVTVRVAALVIPMVALVTGRLPFAVEPVGLIAFGGAWASSGLLARRRAVGRRQSGVENTRVGFRTIGTDLASLLGFERGWGRHHVLLQNLMMGALLTAMSIVVWTTIGGRFHGPNALETFVLLLALLTIPALIRDAVATYRQQRLLPRVTYESRGPGDVIELSPVGLDVDGELPLHSTHIIEFVIPLAGGRSVNRRIPATVVAHRGRGSKVHSYLRMERDDRLATELAYFCGVTAPTMRWHRRDPRAVRRLHVPGHKVAGIHPHRQVTGVDGSEVTPVREPAPEALRWGSAH